MTDYIGEERDKRIKSVQFMEGQGEDPETVAAAMLADIAVSLAALASMLQDMANAD